MKRYKEFIKENISLLKAPWVYNGDFKVTKKMISNGEMIKDKIPDIINGNFNCFNNKLTTLKNSPKKVSGYFSCSMNNLTSLKYCAIIIGKSFYCDKNQLTSLEFGPKEINGEYHCAYNKLTNLKGCPEKINGDFRCISNLLTSLEFGPKEINGSVMCDNHLKIEKGLLIRGYKDYYPDLLRYCIDNNHDLELIKSWPEGFLTDDNIKSAKGISKFGL